MYEEKTDLRHFRYKLFLKSASRINQVNNINRLFDKDFLKLPQVFLKRRQKVESKIFAPKMTDNDALSLLL